MKGGVEVCYNTFKGEPWAFWAKQYASWEEDTFRVFRRFAPGKVVLDIGAWIGPTCLWMANIASRVVALEPTRAAFSHLQANFAMNPSLANKLVLLNVALAAKDFTGRMTNNGDSMDHLQRRLNENINVRVISVETLLQEHPELESTGFIKLDTEGYEKVLVPALRSFVMAKKPVMYVSLHPMYISHAEVQTVVDMLQDTFPYLYEVDMRTPFRTNRSAYTHGDHHGADVVCTWHSLV